MKTGIGFFAFATIILIGTEGLGQDPEINRHVNQLMPKPVPTAPNVAGLGRYGDYQVNLFHGVPEISIPIYQVSSGSLSVPVTLTYHASGIKPTDMASWVGLGWSLSAGGQVARNVQGKPDEEHYYGNPLLANPSVCQSFYYLKYAATGVTDTEPDVFSYSFPGHSGKFMLPHNSQPVLYPYAPLRLNTTPGFGKFEITDAGGVLHRFGANGAGTVFAQDATTATNGGNPSFSATTAWHLMEMVAPNTNDRIDFTYQSLGTSTTHDVSYVYSVKDQCSASNGAPCPSPFNYLPSMKELNSYATQKGLQTIVFEQGKIEFVLGPARQDVSTTLARLAEIKIFSLQAGEYTLEKTVEFVFSYFTNAAGARQALKLDEIIFKDRNGLQVQRYRFEYFTNQFSWNPQSSNFLNARDLWGYYNGATTNTDLVVPTTISYAETAASTPVNITFGGGLNRATNTAYAKEGVLRRITFPTGGYTEFDFEANRYDKSGVPTAAGGVRVTQIKSYDGVSTAPVVKTYKYGEGESGQGIANFRDADFVYHSTMQYLSGCGVANLPTVQFQVRNYYSNSFGGEAPVLYPYVTEYTGDPTGAHSGKTVYTFDSGAPLLDVVHTIPSSSKKYTNSNAWKRGKLTSKRVYDVSNRLVAENTIQYSSMMESSHLVGYGVYQFWDPNPGVCIVNNCVNEAGEIVNPQTFFFGGIYQGSGALVESDVTDKTYQDGDLQKVVAQSKHFEVHPATLQVLQANELRSENSEQKITVSKYPFQYAAVSSSTGSTLAIYHLNQKFILNTPLETYTYVQQTGGVNPRVVSGQVTTFRINEANNGQVVVDKIFLWEAQQPSTLANYAESFLNSSTLLFTFDPRYRERVHMMSYDDAGNLLTASKKNDSPVAYLYGHNKSLPVAEAINATDREIFFQGFEEGITTNVVTNEALSHSGNRYLSGDYTVPFSLPNAKSYQVEYWFLNGSNEWQYVSKAYTGVGMVLSEGSAIDDVRVYPRGAFLKTYTYHPLNGMTGKVDEKGQTYRFEYDPFGRLYRVVDERGNIEKQYTYHYKGN